MNIIKPDMHYEDTQRHGGVFSFAHYRDGKIIGNWDIPVAPNLMPLISRQQIQDQLYNSGSNLTNYLTLFSNNYTPQADDAYSHIGTRYTEITTYTAGTRPAWTTNGAADSSAIVSNSSSPAVFVFNASATIYGAMWVTSSVKGDNTSGVLRAAAKLAAPRTGIISGDEIHVVYTNQATST